MFSRLKKKWTRAHRTTSESHTSAPRHVQEFIQEIVSYFQSEDIVITETETRILLVHFAIDKFCQKQELPTDSDEQAFVLSKLPKTITIHDFESYLYQKLDQDFSEEFQVMRRENSTRS
jgi:hypothetical protein